MPWKTVHLPREVVQHIFTVRASHTDDEALLTFRDRARCMAVCRAWEDFLSLEGWPLQQRLVISWKDDFPPPEWTLQVQPTARCVFVNFTEMPDLNLGQLRDYLSLPHTELRELHLTLTLKQVHAVWPAVYALPALTTLALKSSALESHLLAVPGLPSTLECLKVYSWEAAVTLSGPAPLLPGLTRLVVFGAGPRLKVDAALPTLRELVVERVGQVDLAGANLALPQLTQLYVSVWGATDAGWDSDSDWDWECFSGTLAADFERMPLLASLGINSVELYEDSLASFASLAHLTRLALECSEGDADCVDAAMSLLQQAPTTLRSLHATGCNGNRRTSGIRGMADTLRCLTGLINLTGDCGKAVLPLLGSVGALQELEVQLYGGDSVGVLFGSLYGSSGDFGERFSSLAQLTKLIVDDPSIIPHLAPLRQLRELSLSCTATTLLSQGYTSDLKRLPSLRKVHLLHTSRADAREASDLKALKGYLPSLEVSYS